jgi:hypothetical protein
VCSLSGVEEVAGDRVERESVREKERTRGRTRGRRVEELKS